MRAFFIQKAFAQLSLGMFGLQIFWRQNIVEESECKMLMNLTLDHLKGSCIEPVIFLLSQESTN